MPAHGDFDTFTLLMELFGGLALFLFGMEHMSDALKAVAGNRMKDVLGRLTANRFMGVFTGAFVTSVIQSSSVTTVLVVGFVSAGLMSAAQSVGVIMGANIGTTVTAQIVAFKVTKVSLLMIAVGFGMVFAAKGDRIRQYGSGLMGLGLVFFGMTVMGDAMAPLHHYQPFLDTMVKLESPLLGILAGAVFTALVQSSSATTGVVITMASQGLISLPAGIAIAFGANIGTCVTALLAALGKRREALRAAVVHVLFNVAGVAIWVAFLDPLAELVISFSPVAENLSGLEKLARETPRQIANAHTVFNVANTVLFVGIAGQFARLAERLVPDRPIDEAALIKVRFIDRELLRTPAMAIHAARLEIQQLAEYVDRMLAAILPAVLHGTRGELEAVRTMDEPVDQLHGEILTYLGEVSRQQLSRDQTREILRLSEAVNGLENIGDIIETNLVSLGLARIEGGVTISKQTQQVIARFHESVADGVRQAAQCVIGEDPDVAGVVVGMKPEVNRLAAEAAVHEAKRFVSAEPQRLEAYRLEVDVLENLKRIYYFAKRIARSVLRTDETIAP